MQNDNAGTQQDQPGECQKERERSCALRGRDKPTSQADIRYHHDTQPDLEIGNLFLKVIEFRHDASDTKGNRREDTSKPSPVPSVTAPSN